MAGRTGKSGIRPRLVVAGTGGDAGKTLVTLAIARDAVGRGFQVVPFKKGPDYIDAAWLGWACGRESRHLDTFLMGTDVARASFLRHSTSDGLNLVEGNRGLFDGLDAAGTHSSASLAELLESPVILVLPVRKITASAGAIALGFARMRPGLHIAGVILNRVGGSRHERVVRRAVEGASGLSVIGAVPSMDAGSLLPERHLGLVPLLERRDLDDLAAHLDRVASYIDMGAVLRAARGAPPMSLDTLPGTLYPRTRHAHVRIGVFRDAAFSFYYPDNLEALRANGAEIVFVSPSTDRSLPDVDALYLGGGFPEIHAGALAANQDMLESLRTAAGAGMPIYAECGGLMYLARSITWRGERHRMAGILPVDTVVHDKPKGHGYARVLVKDDNPFFEPGTELRGHEFHYSTIEGAAPVTCMEVLRGHGCGHGRCGIVTGNVLATYVHVHALSEPGWAPAVVRAAADWKAQRTD